MHDLFSAFGAQLVVAGLLVGICVGLTGVGAGSLMAPLLILFFKVDPLVAIGSDLLYAAPTKIVGAFIHARQGTIDRRVTLLLSAGGLAGMLAGVLILQHVRATVDAAALAKIVKHWVGLAVLLSAVLTLASTYVFPRVRVSSRAENAPEWPLVLLGAAVGFTVILTSIGAGAITMPFLALLLRNHRIQLLIGSDLAFAAVVATLSAAMQFHLGNVNVAISLAMLAGSIPGVILGSRLSPKIPHAILKPLVGVCLIVIGWRTL